MTTTLAVIGGILLGVVSNELFDISPWLAGRVLRFAARLDARFDGEAELLLAEWDDHMQQLPGKLTKLCFALGMLLGVALVRRCEQALAVALARLRRAARSFDWRDLMWICFAGLAIGAIAGMFVLIAVLVGSQPVQSLVHGGLSGASLLTSLVSFMMTISRWRTSRREAEQVHAMAMALVQRPISPRSKRRIR